MTDDDYDAKLAQFGAMTKWITEHDPSPEQLAKYDALRAELDRLETPPLRAAALQYVSWGWPVFPLRSIDQPCIDPEGCGKSDYCHCPKRPATRHGFKDAVLDADRVRTYWTANPRANIGLPTGVMFDVFDADLPDGPATLERLMASPKFPAVQGRVRTASGGLHVLITPSPRGNASRPPGWPGIDYRGAGGYVVAPPSFDERGSWQWIDKPSATIRKLI